MRTPIPGGDGPGPMPRLPFDVYLAVRNEAVPANPDYFKPLRDSWGVDRVAKVFDALVAYGKALKPLRGDGA